MTCLIGRLKQRADFLRVAKTGRKAVSPGLIVQAAPRRAAESLPAENRQTMRSETVSRSCRVGFTASRAVGGAVARNRARRRLRAVVREIMPVRGRGEYDYVVIARRSTLRRSYAALLRDLAQGLERMGVSGR